jgi:hypothetical protein
MAILSLTLIIVTVAALLTVVAAATWFFNFRHSQSRHVYQRQLEQALADGIVTPEELRELNNIREKRDLSQAETRMLALAIYRRALNDAAADARITEEEATVLRNMQVQLGLSDADLAADRAQVQRVQLLANAERGQLPDVKSPVQLEPGERAHWVVHGTLCERLGFPGAARSEPAHIEFPIDRSEPFHAAEPRGALAPNPNVLPLDLGIVIITSHATMFYGAKRKVRIPHDSLSGFALFSDGIRMISALTERATYFLLSDPELSGAVLLRAARDVRKHKSRNTATYPPA